MSNQHYIFTPHKNTNPQIRAWDRVRIIGPNEISQIKDTVARRSGAKAATSVPSPFARMHLFETAFEICSKPTLPHNPRPQDGETMYHKQVSDCFDMFQLLFNNSDSGDLTYKVWSKSAELETLLQKDRPTGHKLLGTSLKMVMDKARFARMTDVVMIYFKGKLLGGTSPLTVFFTSPNWYREMQSQGWVLASTTSDNFFDDSVVPLHQRDPEFQKYMVRIFRQNIDLFFSQFPQLAAYLDYYLKNNDLPSEWSDTTSFEVDYEPIAIGKNVYLNCCGLTIYKRKAANVTFSIEQESAFVIQPSVDYYKAYKDESGREVLLPLPLALANGYNQPGMTYIKSPWNSEIKVEESLKEPLHLRVLPGNNQISYPYLVAGDFLADNLVEMPFDLNEEYFFTGVVGKFNYLLPIKKEYFNFFTLSDLKQQLSISRTTVSGIEKIVVELKMPIRNGKSIGFHKEYIVQKEQGRFKEDRFATAAKFGLGIFPFYRITDNASYNDYSIMLVDKDTRDVRLKFYQFPEIIQKKELNYQAKVRVTKGQRAGSTFYRLKGTTFDCIEVSLDGYTGLILPNWGEKYTIASKNSINTFTFAVDFGTSNTHIAYKNQNIPIQSFDITKDDLQVVMLNRRGEEASVAKSFEYGWGVLPEISTYKRREFMPSVVGVSDASVVYPIRTSTCEGAAFRGSGKAELFTNINIGFSIDSEEQILAEDFYEINLKWGLENNKDSNPARERVKAFILQTIWMIKNKVILNNGNLEQLKIAWFLPISMSRQDQRIFRDIWNESIREVLGEVNVEAILFEETESAAPYYFLRQAENLSPSQNAVNIDIGGGTTDCLFLVQKSLENVQYSTSFRFAANDIWGDGFAQIPSSNGGPKDNGFVLMMDGKLQRNEIQFANPMVKDYYHAVLRNQNFSSADVVSFMFKYDKEFNLSQSLQNHPLRSVLLLHFAGIVYHIGQLTQWWGIDVPMYFIFTGNGSKYIRILGEREMDEFAEILLGKVTGKAIPSEFKLRIAPNPKEATANGGVVKLTGGFDQVIKAKPDHFPGFTMEGDEKSFYTNEKKEFLLNETPQVMGRILDNFGKFLDLVFDDRDIKMFLEDTGIRLNPADKQFLKEKAEISFEDMAHRLAGKQGMQAAVPESMFFWCLKDTLYKYSKQLYSK